MFHLLRTFQALGYEFGLGLLPLTMGSSAPVGKSRIIISAKPFEYSGIPLT
jgi:hypothetical protein